MKKFKITISILLVVLVSVSCHDDEIYNLEDEAKVETFAKADSRNATLVFGRYYGKCEGDYCVKIFKLKNKQLKEAVKSSRPAFGEFYEGVFSMIKVSDKINITELFSDFPSMLLRSKETHSIIGLPDAGDWGGIYLEYKDEKLHKQWFLDLNANNLPKELVNYTSLINEKINLIEGDQ